MITEELLKDIFKPNNLKWRTAITKVDPNRLLTRGHLQEDFIGNTSFADDISLNKRRGTFKERIKNAGSYISVIL